MTFTEDGLDLSDNFARAREVVRAMLLREAPLAESELEEEISLYVTPPRVQEDPRAAKHLSKALPDIPDELLELIARWDMSTRPAAPVP